MIKKYLAKKRCKPLKLLENMQLMYLNKLTIKNYVFFCKIHIFKRRNCLIILTLIRFDFTLISLSLEI